MKLYKVLWAFITINSVQDYCGALVGLVPVCYIEQLFGGWTGADVHFLVLAQLIRPERRGPLKSFLLDDVIAKNSGVSIMPPGSLAPVWHASLLALALLIRP